MSDHDRDDELSFKADDAPTVSVPEPIQTGEETREQDAQDVTANAVDNSHVDTAAEKAE
jgi:hypothetical protein